MKTNWKVEKGANQIYPPLTSYQVEQLVEFIKLHVEQWFACLKHEERPPR